MAKEGSYVGRFGDTLRRLTALEAQNGAFAAPQQIGGADVGGFGPTITAEATAAPAMRARPAEEAPKEKQKSGGLSALSGLFGGGGGSPMSGGGGFIDGSGAPGGVAGAMGDGGLMHAANGGQLRPGTTMVGEEGPELAQMDASGNVNIIPNHALPPQLGGFSPMADDPATGGIAGGPIPGIKGPVELGGDKPTSWGDLTSTMPEEEQDKLADETEKRLGAKGIKGFFERAKQYLGDKTPEGRLNRREAALYVAEVALRTMSNRGRPEYAQNPGGVFADALLATNDAWQEKIEAKRKESKADAEVRRKEAREDSIHTRTRSEQAEDHARDRDEKLQDDARDHQQALELARVQAKLLRERNKRTSIQVDEDGTLVLVDEDGNAVDVTKEVEETTPVKGSRGQGTTGGKPRKVRKPVKAKPKFNASGLDQDTLINRVTDAEKALRGNRKLMSELASKFANDQEKIEAELRRMAREKVDGDVSSLGASPDGGDKVIDFNDFGN